MKCLPLAALLSLFTLALVSGCARHETLKPHEVSMRSTKDLPPRKVIVGTMIQGFWDAYPGLDERLNLLTGWIDKIAAGSRKKYGRNPDLIVFSESAVTCGLPGSPAEQSLPWEGKVADAFTAKAKEYGTYLVVTMYMVIDREKGIYGNVAVVLDRQGKYMGYYQKMHPAVNVNSESLEGGITPGEEAPVFECDFGKLGVQICFDMSFDPGWEQLRDKGADLVVWPTASPSTVKGRIRAYHNRYYIVSSTWRAQAAVFEPTGLLTAHIKEPETMLVQEIDLSYAILPWSGPLDNGKALTDLYGDKIGYRYYPEEDVGIFWSNDSRITVGEMVKKLGVAEDRAEEERLKKLFKDKRGPLELKN